MFQEGTERQGSRAGGESKGRGNSSRRGTGMGGSKVGVPSGTRGGHGSSSKGLLEGRGGSYKERNTRTHHLWSYKQRNTRTHHLWCPEILQLLIFHMGDPGEPFWGPQSKPSTADAPEGPLIEVLPSRYILQLPLWISQMLSPAHYTKLLGQPHKSLSLEQQLSSAAKGNEDREEFLECIWSRKGF